MSKVGIIGFGSFGKFLAEKLNPHTEVLVYSSSGKQNIWSASLDAVASADFVLLAIPLDAYEPTLQAIKNKLHKKALL